LPQPGQRSFPSSGFFLDLDPHSGTTKLVLVFAPVISLGLGALGSGVAWFVVRVT
jgi:hypothetical protein